MCVPPLSVRRRPHLGQVLTTRRGRFTGSLCYESKNRAAFAFITTTLRVHLAVPYRSMNGALDLPVMGFAMIADGLTDKGPSSPFVASIWESNSRPHPGLMGLRHG